MRISRFAFRNLTRRKIRTSLTVFGVAIAVSVLVSFLGFSRGYRDALSRSIERMGFHVLIAAEGCPIEAATLLLKGGGGLRYMDDGIYEEVLNDPRVDKVAPRLIQTLFDPTKGPRGGTNLIMGIDDTFLQLKPWTKFQEGGWFSSPDAEEVILGYQIADFEKRTVGDLYHFPGLGKTIKVAGVFERSGAQEDGTAFMPLLTVQKIFDLPGKLTGVGVKLRDFEQLGSFMDDYSPLPNVQVISLAQVRYTILALVHNSEMLVASVAIVAIFIAVIGVVNAILMSVFERTHEIGVMMTIGAPRFYIFKLIWLETIMVCAIGGILGLLMAYLGGRLVEVFARSVLSFTPMGRLVRISLPLSLLAFLGAIVIGMISGTYPACRAARMVPVDAVRAGHLAGM